jgi:hypothetical protein
MQETLKGQKPSKRLKLSKVDEELSKNIIEIKNSL